MAAAKPKKPSDDEILAALRVLEELGSRHDYAYEKLVGQLPKSKRPPSSQPVTGNLLFIGNDGLWDLPEAALDKVEAAVKAAWKPVSVKIGAKTYTVEFSDIEF